jgi:hypothetical protein
MTTKRPGRRVAWLLAAAAAAAGPAAAAQFTFTVPVEIRDIDPRYPYMEVGCNVFGADNAMIGFKNVMIDIRPNSRPYSANVTVAVDPLAGKSAAAVTHYHCILMFCTSTVDTTCVRPMTSNLATPQPEPGTPFTIQVDGPIR